MSLRVRDTDLLGRAGTLSVGARSVETPAFLPVMHPVRQIVPGPELLSMGFGAAMTNSYITYRRYGHGISEVGGIHGALGYDGILMTDSGGYQVLEYGEVDVDPLTIAEYQVEMGSDVAVVLDRPTGASAPRERASETVEATLRAARETLPVVERTRGRMAWAIPIQGGLHLDLVERSARESSALPYDVYSVGSPVELMNSYRFVELARLLLTAKRNLPPERPVHLFGAGHPLTMALAVAFGADTFDSASYALFARELRYMTRCGVRELGELSELPCSCPICSRHSLRELRELPREELVGLLARHNLYVLREELLDVRQALREGRLWEYLMQKTGCHPSLHGIRSLMVEASGDFAEFTRLFKKRAAFLFGPEDVRRPELESARSRVRRVAPRGGSVVLVVAPSVDARAAQSMGDDHYFVVPFLGVVPPGLSDVYPFSQNASPGPGHIDRRVLEDTASAAADVLSGWRISSASIRVISADAESRELASLLAARLRELGVSVSESHGQV
ncbi:MAG: tRNA guanosine(15) transglycosylase TgtA [Conexivisphaera sp.]